MAFVTLRDKLECARRTNKFFAKSAITATHENTKTLQNLSEIAKESSQIYDSNSISSSDNKYNKRYQN